MSLTCQTCRKAYTGRQTNRTTHRHAGTHKRQGGSDTGKQTNIATGRQHVGSHICRHRGKQVNLHAVINAGKQSCRQTHIHMGTWAYIYTGRYTYRQADKHTSTQAGMHTGRQTGIHIYRHVYIHTYRQA